MESHSHIDKDIVSLHRPIRQNHSRVQTYSSNDLLDLIAMRVYTESVMTCYDVTARMQTTKTECHKQNIETFQN